MYCFCVSTYISLDSYASTLSIDKKLDPHDMTLHKE